MDSPNNLSLRDKIEWIIKELKKLRRGGGGSSGPETDPTVPSHVKAITQTNLNSWNSVAQNYLGYVDDRSISPNDLGTEKIQFGFTSFTNNNTAPWADFIHFGGYIDASGGNQNLIVFNKTNFGIRQYQGTFQSGTSYNNYVDYWHSGNFNPNNYYTKTQLQTSGQASVNWGNLTNIPATFAPSAHNHDDRYYTETESDGRFVPYTGATANVNLGTNNQIRAKEFDAIGTYAEKPNTNRNYEFVKLNGSTIGVYQSQMWNGSAWVDSSSFGFGLSTLQYNKGIYSNGFGYLALQNNIGGSSNGFGYFALRNNIGDNSNGFGYYALQNNTGSYSNGFGYLALQNNIGNNSNGFGYLALRYNTGANNSVLGYNSFAIFYADTVNAKLFDATAIDIVAKTITIPNHAFGANGTYTNLRFTQGNSAVTGLSNGEIVQVKIIDANTIAFEEVIQSGQVRRNINITNAGTGTGHKFEPQKSLSNINILGANINPTKSNQTIFAGGEAILPQSTIATIDGDATNKALITKEWYNSKTSTSLSNYYTKSEAVNMFVGLNGVQTIGGTKTFNESPVVPNPTLNAHAVNKGYIDTELNKKSEKNTDEEWNSKKYLSNPFPLIFNDPTENTRRFGFHKPNNISSVILVPSTEPDSDNWDLANQIEFKENGKIKNKGYEIVGKDDNSVLTAGGSSAHKKELLWSRKLTIQPSSTNAYYPEPQGQVTNIDITGHGSTDATVYLPQEAYNGQIINIVNYSAENIKISGIDAGEFSIGQNTMVTMTFVFNTNNIDGVTYGTGRWVGMYMNEFNKLE